VTSTVSKVVVRISCVLLCAACARVGRTPAPILAPGLEPVAQMCADCGTAGLEPEVTRAIERRITDLVSRGSQCLAYGEILERSYRDRRIVVRPFMWRVGPHLVSGEATRDGAMVLARDIDSLNVGVRTVDDLLRSMEHEAVHIAFDISSGKEHDEDRVNAFVRECGSTSTVTPGTATGGARRER
jgi:hypothetical protein